MSCRKWERWISDAQDGELSLRRQRHLKLHFGIRSPLEGPSCAV